MTQPRTAGRLGRLPHDPFRDALHLGPHLTGAAPPNPPVVDWLSRVQGWPMYGNDQWGDCVWAMAGHIIEAASTYGQGATVAVTEDALLKGYSDVTGFDPNAGKPGENPTDQGTVIADMLSYWRKTGIAGHKILAYAKVDVGNRFEIDAALNLFGHLALGVNFPNIAMRQFEQHRPWAVVADDGGSDGGHAVNLGYYNTANKDERVVTWGAVQDMTDGWWARYVEEAWAVITPEWLDATGHSPVGLDLEGLGAEFAGLTKEPNPFPAPSPAPPPAPTPGPVPDAADLELARVLAPWLREHHVGGNHRAQQAVLAWEAAKGIPDMAGRG